MIKLEKEIIYKIESSEHMFEISKEIEKQKLKGWDACDMTYTPAKPDVYDGFHECVIRYIKK